MKSSTRPYFKMLPGWIYDSMDYKSLGGAERWLLHLMSGQADEKLEDGSRVGCRMEESKIQAVAGLSVRTYRRYVADLERAGFLVKVGQGGGTKLANEYGVPVELGALDHKKLAVDPRFQTRRTVPRSHGLDSANRVNLSAEPCQIVPQTVTDCPPNRDRMAALYTSSIKENTLNNTPKAVFVSDFSFDDDDKAVTTRELPDDASEEVRAKALEEHHVGIRRAKKIARKTSAESIRNAINLTHKNSPRNPGAYICELIEGEHEAELARYASEQAEQYRKIEEQLAEADKRLDAMSDGDMANLIAAHCERTGLPTKGMTPEFVRTSKMWRKGVTQTLLALDMQGVTA